MAEADQDGVLSSVCKKPPRGNWEENYVDYCRQHAEKYPEQTDENGVSVFWFPLVLLHSLQVM